MELHSTNSYSRGVTTEQGKRRQVPKQWSRANDQCQFSTFCLVGALAGDLRWRSSVQLCNVGPHRNPVHVLQELPISGITPNLAIIPMSWRAWPKLPTWLEATTYGSHQKLTFAKVTVSLQTSNPTQQPSGARQDAGRRVSKTGCLVVIGVGRD